MTRKNRASLSAAIALALTAFACDHRAPIAAREDTAEASHTSRFTEGALAFGEYCALCHAADASGYAADHAPSLVSATFLESATDEFIARGIREGRPGTAMAAYGKSRGGPLDDDKIAAILVFLRDRGPLHAHLTSTPVVGDVTRGEAIYTSTCKRCHGTAVDRGDAVQLANSALLSAASDSFLRYAVVHGRPGTPMPAFEGTLDEGQLDDVVAMVRSGGSPPDPARFPSHSDPPPLGDVVLNPSGKAPDFVLREDRYVPIEDVKRALQAKKRMVIIDARAYSDWLTMHVPGAVSVPYYLLSRLDTMPRDGTWILAYCACPHHASGVVMDELRKRGFRHTAVLDEGILEWKKRKYPVASAPPDPGDETTPPSHSSKR